MADIRFTNTLTTVVVSSSPTTFYGIQINNMMASGVTVVVSDSAAAGTTTPYAMWFVAKSGASLPVMPFLNRGVRMTKGIWLQLLGGGSGCTAICYHGG